jgi:hypothetical protein
VPVALRKGTFRRQLVVDREVPGSRNVTESLYKCSNLYSKFCLYDGDWRSWLARAVWDREVGGSSPLSPTMKMPDLRVGFFHGQS